MYHLTPCFTVSVKNLPPNAMVSISRNKPFVFLGKHCLRMVRKTLTKARYKPILYIQGDLGL